MGYLSRIHQCSKPTDSNKGDIWECDECKRAFIDSIWGWTPFTGQVNVDGILRRYEFGIITLAFKSEET